ncbi:MAG: head-tail connector protein [Pseudomonadota bacterium]
MNLTIVTPPAIEPVSVAQLKAFCRIDHDDSDDLVEALGTSAREYVEQALGRTFLTTTYSLKLPAFPSHGERIELPRGPLQSVEDVSYTNKDGSTTPVEETDYHVAGVGNVLGMVPSLSPKTRWPDDVADEPEAVAITFKCGYGANASDTPQRLRLCIKALTAWWFEQREPGLVASNANEVPYHVGRLINSAKTWLAA